MLQAPSSISQSSHSFLTKNCFDFLSMFVLQKKKCAMAGNRTRINCLEGNYADHYTTIALDNTVTGYSDAPTRILSSKRFYLFPSFT